jgi:hypothetical protein
MPWYPLGCSPRPSAFTSAAPWQSVAVPVKLVRGQARCIFLPTVTGVAIEGWP